MSKDVTFEEILILLGREVIGVLKNKGSSLEDAEDAVSKTYEIIFSSLMSISEENLRPWFFRVSYNNYIDIYRKKRRESNYFKESSNLIESTNNGRFFQEIIESLKPGEQEIMLLKYYYQLSYEEISVLLSLNVETVRKKLYRIRKKLKSSWEI